MANYELIDTVGGVEYYEGNGTFDGNSNGKDDITGGDGADTINAGNGDDTVTGGAGNDTINAGNGDDTVTGGAGDDMLAGGNNADTFNYNFTLTTSSGTAPQSYAAYLDETLGKAASALTQSEFSTTYSAWLDYLVFGGDDGWLGLVEHYGWDGEVTVGLNQNGFGDSAPHISVDGVLQDLGAIFGDLQTFSWSKGKATQTRTFWDLEENYDWGGDAALSSTDGNDSITDFNATQGDKLFFTVDIDDSLLGGDTTQLIAEFKSQFEVTTGEFGGDANPDTKMVADGAMSITLLGYGDGAGIWDHVQFDFV